MPQREVLAISSRGSTGRIQLIDERIVLGTKELSDEL
jgi:hypothetical protein